MTNWRMVNKIVDKILDDKAWMQRRSVNVMDLTLFEKLDKLLSNENFNKVMHYIHCVRLEEKKESGKRLNKNELRDLNAYLKWYKRNARHERTKETQI